MRPEGKRAREGFLEGGREPFHHLGDLGSG